MRKLRKALDEKMQVKLPESLNKEAITEKLELREEIQHVKSEKKEKRPFVKFIAPLAASLAVVVGLMGLLPAMRTKSYNKESGAPELNQAETVRCNEYGEIYNVFKAMKSKMIMNSYDDAGYDMALPEAGMANGSSTEDYLYSENDRKFGTTNIQEKGVDEGDVIKTDGKYLYTVTRSGGERLFAIIDCADGKMTKTAQIKLGENIENAGLYIYGNYAVITGSKYDYDSAKYGLYDRAVADSGFTDCLYSPDGDTAVTVYDISDKTAPRLTKEFVQQGLCSSTRMIGSKLYCVSTYYVNLNSDNIMEDCIPHVAVDGKTEKLAADCITVIKDTESPSYAIISVYDVKKGGEPGVEAVLGNSENIYVTTDSFFINECVYENSQQFTKIYKFGYTDSGVKYEAFCKAAGHINNQFSLSCNGTHLRVATTNDVITESTTIPGSVADTAVSSFDNTENALYIFDKDMKQVGKTENIAPGERIKSVRFIGDMAYVVTFRQTDPLFAIDLNDPQNPKVLGQLKITGFSEYLHPYSKDLLIGIGNDGTETGTNGDCKVSLFDVSDPANPSEASKLTVLNGRGYCRTAMGYNHKLYIKISDTDFAVPFVTDSYIKGGSYSDSVYIRYRAENNQLTEVARYSLGRHSNVFGGTFIDDIFYTLASSSDGKTQITAFSLDTNEETGRITLN